MYALSTNLKTVKATTQFDNYDFNSFCNFEGRSLAAGDLGLHELGGDSDSGQPISAFFELNVNSFGTLNPKHIRFLYLAYEASAAFTLTVLDSVTNTPHITLINPVVPMQPQRVRVPVPRNVIQTFWVFKVENIGGSDFSIDLIEALFIKRSHGFSYSS